MLEEAGPDHAIRSTIAITKLLLGCDILTRRRNKEEKFKLFFSQFVYLVIVHQIH